MKKQIVFLLILCSFFILNSCANRAGSIRDNEKKTSVSDGYSSQDSRNYTGSASVVEELDQAIPLETYLRGVSGVLVNGQGKNAQVRIRGLVHSFVGDSEPLFVINGNAINGGFSTVSEMVPTNDIKSVSVLKDAGSTGIYGSRAANGVIVIQLKKSND